MKITQIKEPNQSSIITLTNEQNVSFQMQYGGADFYW